jgi:hypothetical protein
VQAYLDFLLAEHIATIELQWRRTFHQLNIYETLLKWLLNVELAHFSSFWDLSIIFWNFPAGSLPLPSDKK